MAKRVGGKLSPAKLRDAYKADLAAAWELSRREHVRESPYAFVLYGVEGGCPPRFTPAVLTEQSLASAARKYIENSSYDTLDEACKGLRWSVADSPHLAELEDCTPTVDVLVHPFARSLDDDKGYAVLAKAAIAALRELDAERLFGTDAAREQLLLIIITEDTPQDWSSRSARLLNSPAAFERFEKSTAIEGTYASSDSIAIAPDGLSLYSGGCRRDPDEKPGEPEYIQNLTAFDLLDQRLERRWAYEFPGGGDSIHDIALSPNGSIVALRMKYVKHVCHAMLMRFDRDSSDPVAQHQFIGEPSGLALSRDETRIAVTLHNKTVHLFDADFRPVVSHLVGVKVYRARFLKSDDLLISTDKALLRLAPDSDGAPEVVAPLPALQLAIDSDESMLAVARWFPLSGPERENPVEFRVNLLRLPTFEFVRSFGIAGHQAVNPAISPDGRLIAIEAKEIGKQRWFIVVFETATGLELARRKSNFTHAIQFLPDSQTLVIAGSGITTTVPIAFWRIP